MPKIGGYLLVLDPDGPTQEWDTVKCVHCQRIVIVKPGSWGQVYLIPQTDGSFREEAAAFCRQCNGPICLPCDTGTCLHWERRMEQEEARWRLAAAMGGESCGSH